MFRRSYNQTIVLSHLVIKAVVIYKCCRRNHRAVDKVKMATFVKDENTKTCELNEWELEVATKVFRSFETGLREGTILPKVSLVLTH